MLAHASGYFLKLSDILFTPPKLSLIRRDDLFCLRLSNDRILAVTINIQYNPDRQCANRNRRRARHTKFGHDCGADFLHLIPDCSH